MRHLFAQPRGRGPSQTPPSLATDSSSPPVPPLLGCRLCSPVPRPNRRAPPRRVPLTPAEPATQGHAPRRARGSPPFPSAARVQARGCKGRSPLHKNNLKFPPSRREGGAGGWGQKSKLKAGAVGNKEGTPTTGCVIRPHFPAPRGFRRGDARGAAPCIKITLISPFPPGRGLGGWGRKRKLKAEAGRQQRRHAPPQTISKWGLIFRKNYGIL